MFQDELLHCARRQLSNAFHIAALSEHARQQRQCLPIALQHRNRGAQLPANARIFAHFSLARDRGPDRAQPDPIIDAV